MSKLEVEVLIGEAIEQALKVQQTLLSLEDPARLLPICLALSRFLSELQQWRDGKHYLKDQSGAFLKQAAKIESEANRLSRELWRPVPVSLLPVFEESSG
jgi:hypothetical protein